MIKNERQYQATRKQIELLTKSLNVVTAGATPPDPNDAIFRDLQLASMQSQLHDLEAEAKEYEDLRAGITTSLRLDSLTDIPKALIAARISSNLTQKELAARVGIREQVLQRYEASDYASASFDRIREIAAALDLGMREEAFLPASGASVSGLFRRLGETGIDRQFLLAKVLPPDLLDAMESGSGRNLEPGVGSTEVAVRAASTVERVYGLGPASIFGSDDLLFPREAYQTARFKVPTNANEKRLAAYAVYAHYIGQRVAEAIGSQASKELPVTAEDFRQALLGRYGSLDVQTALLFIWDHGIPVLPFADPGAFHGAVRRHNGRNIIALNQRTSSSSRWLINLLHEVGHALQNPDEPEFGIVEEREDLSMWKESKEEEEAIWFALDVALDGRAEDLAEESVRRARGSVELLKGVLPQVARDYAVDLGVLADYMAFRLEYEGVTNWWGPATNLQPEGQSPLQRAREIFWARVDLKDLDQFDRELLYRAFTDIRG